MFRPRVIPCLLLKDKGLVKSVKFKDHKYVGDPINAVKIFNDKKADELVFLDITATAEKRTLPLELIERIGDECNMPFAVGGGITTIDQIRELIQVGAEKVCINTKAVEDPQFIREASNFFGSTTITVVIDVKKNFWGKRRVYIKSGKKATDLDPVAHAKNMAEMGAGEIIINSIEKDGTQLGYDLELTRQVAEAVTIPVIALGGAGKLEDFKEAATQGKASAMAAGSFFVFHGKRRAVLINFPNNETLKKLFSN